MKTRFFNKNRKYIYLFSSLGLFGYIYNNNSNISIVHNTSNLNDYIIKNSNYININFSSSLYFPFRFMSIIWGNVYDKRDQINYEREIFYSSDEENIALDWLKSKDNSDSVCIVFPGIFGTSNSNYIRPLVKSINDNNVNVVVSNPRGLCIPLKKDDLFAEKIDDDVKEVCNYICNKYKNKKVYIVGTSLGASIASRYLAKNQTPDNLKGFISISNPYDVHEAASIATKWYNIIYGNHLAKGMKKMIFFNEEKFKQISNEKNLNWDFEKIKKAKTTFELDQLLTKKFYPKDYSSSKEYYKKLSCNDYIKNIKIPSLFINSKNDPISHSSLIPLKEIKDNENIIFLLTKKGGHVEFFTGLNVERWYTKVSSDYINWLNSYDYNK